MPHRTSSAAAGPALTIYNVMVYCCVSLSEASSLHVHVLLPQSNMDGLGQGFYLGKKQQIHQFFPEPSPSECLLGETCRSSSEKVLDASECLHWKCIVTQ